MAKIRRKCLSPGKFPCQSRPYIEIRWHQSFHHFPSGAFRRFAGISAFVALMILSTHGVAAEPTMTVSLGLLGEYFTPLPSSCNPLNGSNGILRGLVPNISRIDKKIDFGSRLSFNLQRCIWDRNSKGKLKYNCRGSERLLEGFGARWTGYVNINRAGDYSFELEADDGARLVLGQPLCPGAFCGTFEGVMNTEMRELNPTAGEVGSFGVRCPLCAYVNVGDQCWVSNIGCEPFKYFGIEFDGGDSGPCRQNLNSTVGSHYMAGGRHPIRLEYFQRGGDARMILRYKGPDTNGLWMVVPSTALIFPDHAGLNAEWFLATSGQTALPPAGLHGALPHGARFLKFKIDDMQGLQPNGDIFSMAVEALDRPLFIRWSGYFEIFEAGLYKFIVKSDDGSRLILGGRGGQRELVLVNNDGLKDAAEDSKGEFELGAGMWPLRIEFFWEPPLVRQSSSSVVIRYPPGIIITYSGPDTGASSKVDLFQSLFKNGGVLFTTHDPGCSMHSYMWGEGMTVTRDCVGRCLDAMESTVGDFVCDNGGRDVVGLKPNLLCVPWQFDNGDCEERPGKTYTTPQPQRKCLVTAPSGEWHRHFTSICGGASDSGGHGEALCKEDDTFMTTTVIPGSFRTPPWETGWSRPCKPPANAPKACLYESCCVATLTNIPFWSRYYQRDMCVAFGAPFRSNCSYELRLLLERISEATPSINDRAAWTVGQRKAIPTTGKLTKACSDKDYCNTIPNDMIFDSKRLEYTDVPVCPYAETEDEGLECWEGPWDVLRVTDPFNECQGTPGVPGSGRYKWNFCLNRKTYDGKPFARCCSFVYINTRGLVECRFIGIPQGGTCETWMSAFFINSQRSSYTEITSPMTMNDCLEPECNIPDDPDIGCPDVINKNPGITQKAVQVEEQVPNLETMLDGAPERNTKDPPWAIIFVAIGGTILVILMLAGVKMATTVTPEPLYHSRAAKVVTDETFVEPEKDPYLEHLGDATIGVVKPRPFGLRMLMKESKFTLPKALRDKKRRQEISLGMNPTVVVDPITFALDIHSKLPIPEKPGRLTATGSVADACSATTGRASVVSNVVQAITDGQETDAASDDLACAIGHGHSGRSSPVRLMPGQLPGQVQDQDEQAAINALAITPVATAATLTLALPEHSPGAAGQAAAFPAIGTGLGPYTLHAQGIPQRLPHRTLGVPLPSSEEIVFGGRQAARSAASARMARNEGGRTQMNVCT
eukprot:TRINITY_DN73953_c0_g1_i1.p1 TRINITY_DN73953_c0_g1~~TRINITY_DN73953_c0_g1_i1.p1  ORF type:complete len:1221 (+),score=122.92 TRINITY_DN73953_c0_g1_i1:164-3826(+)